MLRWQCNGVALQWSGGVIGNGVVMWRWCNAAKINTVINEHNQQQEQQQEQQHPKQHQHKDPRQNH